MRALAPLVLLVAALGACFDGAAADKATNGSGSGFGSGSGSGSVGSTLDACMVDGDCTLAAASCCACPTFAVGVSDPYAGACADVTCPTPPTCGDSLVAACRDFVCVAACREVTCAASCDGGFALDAAGCLTCACAPPDHGGGGCVHDSDCVEVAADCCGCMAGGMDTAVLASEAAAFEASLGCSADVHCPPTNTCMAGASPRCIQGSCALVTAGLPAGACGRPDLPACPSGQVCILDRDPDATALGVGVCGTP